MPSKLGDFNVIYEARDKNNLNLNRRIMGRFRMAINAAALREIRCKNRRFTWSNERESPTLVSIDKFFANTEWEALFPSYMLTAASSSCSDHCPLVLASMTAPPTRARFRFGGFWPRFPHFRETVQRAWQRPVNQTCAFARIKTKMERVAKDLKLWSKTIFSDAKVQFHMANELILRFDIAMETRQLTPQEFSFRKLLKQRVLGLAAVERARRRQVSRMTWLWAGDANTSFFNAKINSRRRKNFIHHLRTDTRIATEHEDKAELIRDHFQSILGTKEQRSCTLNWQELQLPRVAAAGLDNPFTEEEVWAAVLASPGEKAPGPDGFNGTFYHSCWDIIKGEVMAMFHQFHSLSGANFVHINDALVALLPKKDGAERVGDFRPISLIN